MAKKRKAETQSVDELEQIEKESEAQALPEQAQVFSISKRFSKLHNLPDITNPPMGYEPGRGYDNVYPFVKLPFLHPEDPEDNVSFNYGDAGYLDQKNQRHSLNAVYFGDNLQILRSLPSDSIDLIYIDPPFFSGRTYNQVWGDDNELRTFSDIWDGGMPTYLIWLNTRIWEMKRVLKKKGVIYVHCDWHASHYIKGELDKVFGYDNFLNEIVWSYEGTQSPSTRKLASKHDVIFRYAKNSKEVTPNELYYEHEIDHTYSTLKKDEKGYFRIQGLGDYSETSIKRLDAEGRIYHTSKGTQYLKHYVEERDGRLFKKKKISDVWEDITQLGTAIQKEKIGYPTQKPEKLLRRILEIDTKENDIVADFFMGGGTTLAAAQKLGRRFIGSDISRVAVSVTLERLVKDAEEMTGHKASSRKDKKEVQAKLVEDQKVPDIYVYYHGIYPTDKFGHLAQEDFDTFVLTCFGASKNTVADGVTGFKTQFEPILVGPASPRDTLSVDRVKEFVQSVIGKHIQENQRYTLTMIAWKFDPAIQEYRRQLLKSFFKKLQDRGVVLEIELIPIRSKQFRERIATTYGVPEEDKEKLMQFVESPIINEIVVKKTADKKLTYTFEALAKSLNQGSKLINCQWDFNYENGNFSDPEFALRRKAIKGNGFEADLIAEKSFTKAGTCTIACKVQDNFGGETIKTMEFEVEE